MMYLILDAILVLIMAIVVIIAARRGFVDAVFRFLTVIVSLGVAIAFYRTLGAYLDAQFVRDWLAARQFEFTLPTPSIDVAGFLEENTILSAIAKSVGVDLRGAMQGALTSSASDALLDQATNAVSLVISNLIAFILIFICALLLLKLLRLLLNAIFRLPVLRTVNRFLGFLFGLCEAAVIGVVLSTVLVGVFESYGLVQPDFPLADAATQTYVIRFLAGLFH